MNPELSVVLPAYNEAAEIGRTVDALVEAVRRSGLVAEVILVDDGSTDDTVAVAEQRAAGRLPLRVLRQQNSGRLEARRAGLEAADADLALLLDARVTLAPDALRFVAGRVGEGDDVWTGHVDVAADIRARRASERPTSTTSRRAPGASSRRANCYSTRSPRSTATTPSSASRTTTRRCCAGSRSGAA